MKNIIIAIAFFFLSFVNAQDKKIYSLEFYSWVGANDNISYEVASIVFESNIDSQDIYCNNKEYNAQIRVKYSEKGVEKIFDYNAYVNILYLDNQTEIQNKNGNFYTMIIDGYAPARLIKGTGNYNPKTARFYEDLGIISADQTLTEDLSKLFNQLSGMAPASTYTRLLVAPRSLRTGSSFSFEPQITPASRSLCPPMYLVAECHT